MGERERQCGRVLLIGPRESDKHASEDLDLLSKYLDALRGH